MEDPWPLIGRARELERIAALVARGTGGLVIAGGPGAGKSRLGAEALRLAEASGAATARVVGTRALSGLPLGVFTPLLPSSALDLPSRPDDGSDLLRRCRETVLQIGGDAHLVLLVDDAHLIDGVSASLVRQLIGSPNVIVIACVEAGAATSDSTVGLWKEDGVERIEVAGLEEDAIEELLVAVLGGPVDRATAHALAVAADRSIVFLRELVLSALDNEVLRQEIGVWRLVGPLLSSHRMVELVELRLEGLSQTERQVLELVAFGEPLTPGELPGVDLDVIQDLERRSMVTSRLDGARMEVRIAHAVYGQVLRDRVPALRAREIARQLADAVEATGMRRRGDVLRVASWRLEGGGSNPSLMLEAARVAWSRNDLALAERLARRSAHLAGGFDAPFLAAQLAGKQGRGVQADSELAELAESASDDRERGLVAAARLDNLVFDLGHVDLGLDIALKAESSITDPDWRDEITAKRSSVLAGVYGPRAGAEVAVPVVEHGSGRALVWASLVSSYALGRLGELDRARDISVRGQVAHLDLKDAEDWHPWKLVFFEAEALGHLGRIDEAEQITRQMYQEAIDDGALEKQAWFAWQMSKFAADRGSAETAATFGRLAVALFQQLGSPQFEHFALGCLATAFAIGGHQRESRETLEFMDRLGLPAAHYWSVDVLQARAWTEVAHGDLPAATQQFRGGIAVGAEIGDLVGEAACWHGLARVGVLDDGADRLESLAMIVDGPLVKDRAAHVRALIDGDPTRLDAVSDRFSLMGAHLLAAEAAADASVGWRAAGDPRKATASGRRAATLAQRCESPATPALAAARISARLTPAERTAAMLAANGRTSREIAEELVVSVRTVENHLQHVYEKLGIRGRAELKAAIAQSPVES
jgi:DNA-binding CsgD family transcriptional regulator